MIKPFIPSISELILIKINGASRAIINKYSDIGLP